MKLPSKYGNKRTVVDGYAFDSLREAYHYSELKLLLKAQVIKELEIHPRYLLQPGFVDRNGINHRPIYYEADFSYKNIHSDILTVEDVKGMKTEVYKLKKKLFLYKYQKLVDFIELL